MSEYQGNEEDLAEVMERIGKTARKLMPGEPPRGYGTGFGIAPRHALMLIGRIEELERENERLRDALDRIAMVGDSAFHFPPDSERERMMLEKINIIAQEAEAIHPTSE